MSITTASKQAKEQLLQPAQTHAEPESDWQLVGSGGLSNGLSLYITSNRALIGRDNKCDLVLDSGHVDLVSASIQLIDDSVHLESQSIEPIYINNVAIASGQAVVLKASDTITIDVFRLSLTNIAVANTGNTQSKLANTSLTAEQISNSTKDKADTEKKSHKSGRALVITMAVVLIVASVTWLAL